MGEMKVTVDFAPFKKGFDIDAIQQFRDNLLIECGFDLSQPIQIEIEENWKITYSQKLIAPLERIDMEVTIL